MKYEIGTKIRHFRELRGLSQKSLSIMINVPNTRISNWEQGLNRPDVDTLILICEALQVTADELLGLNSSSKNLTDEEFQIITHYRSKPELQQAVRILLGMDITTP